MSTTEFDPVGGRAALLYDGPLIPVEISAPLPIIQYLADNDLPSYPTVRGLAQIDTGAGVSAVDMSVFLHLGIPRVDSQLIQTAHGLAELDRFNASVRLVNLPLFPLWLERVLGGQVRSATMAGEDMIMLIGRDILQRMSFTYDGLRGRFSMTV